MGRRALVVAVAILVGVACSSERERRSALAGTVTAGAPSQWELVYDRDVGGNVDLYVIPAGGGTERRLTDDPGADDLARWTPDGKRVVFTSNRTGTPQLWEVAAEGGPARRVRSNTATEYQSDPSPDGRQLAFLSNLDGPERLMVQDL
jgi:TolB protein